MNSFFAKNEKETQEFAEKIAKILKPGMVLALIGDLGTGKTTFTRYLGKALGATERITSPTFTIVQEYRTGVVPIFHFDVYRIGGIEEMEDIGYEEYFYGEAITVVEWADMIEEILPEDTIKIYIEMGESEGRSYKIQGADL